MPLSPRSNCFTKSSIDLTLWNAILASSFANNAFCAINLFVASLFNSNAPVLSLTCKTSCPKRLLSLILILPNSLFASMLSGMPSLVSLSYSSSKSSASSASCFITLAFSTLFNLACLYTPKKSLKPSERSLKVVSNDVSV